jgi:CheY-like chemotaxis protein
LTLSTQSASNWIVREFDNAIGVASHPYPPSRGKEHGEEDRRNRVPLTIEPNEPIAQNASAVLLIDDNAIQAATRQAILRRAGYNVIAVLDPARALEQFQHRNFPATITAVITDHIMPGMTGAEFVRALRKKHPDLPVMVISGLEEAEPEYHGLDVRFLLKPLQPELLLANLRGILACQEQGAA